jgi:hypothetical protein
MLLRPAFNPPPLPPLEAVPTDAGVARWPGPTNPLLLTPPLLQPVWSAPAPATPTSPLLPPLLPAVLPAPDPTPTPESLKRGGVRTLFAGERLLGVAPRLAANAIQDACIAV